MPPRDVTKNGPNPVDLHVGSRLRRRRVELGMSQSKLADTVGVSFQQTQKYEKGINRVGASRLYEFSQILDVPIAYFFNELSQGEPGSRPGPAWQGVEILTKSETSEFVDAYYRITDPNARKQIRKMVATMARMSDD